MSELKAMDQVGVQFVNVLVGRGVVNNVVNLQFGTYQFTPAGDEISPDLAVSCRLRMDLSCAHELHAQLGMLLDMAAAAVTTPEKPN